MPDDLFAISQARTALRTGRMQALRERAQLTQADIARAVGVSQGEVCRWESLQRRPGRRMAERLGHLMLALEDAERREG
jgi:DNA-binding transcriptional regulator YiaG